MFDETPSNLPLEPGKAPPPQPSSSAQPKPPAQGPGPAEPPAPLKPVPPAPSEPDTSSPPASGGAKEPEDIFAGVDIAENNKAEVEAPAHKAPRQKGSIGKILGAIVLILIFVIVAAGALWYFLIREKPLPVFEESEVSEEMIIETPPALPPEFVTPTPSLPAAENIGAEEVATSTPEEEPVEEIPESAAIPAPDTDNDGLTDPEEAVFGTDPALADTDSDTYPDGAEFRSGYDPMVQGAELKDSRLFRSVVLASEWSVLLPTSWTVLSDQIMPGDIVIETESMNVIKVHFDQKPEVLLFESWFASNESISDFSSLVELDNANGLEGWLDEVGRTAYLTDGTAILVLRYQTGGSGSVDYPNLFEHMHRTMEKN